MPAKKADLSRLIGAKVEYVRQSAPLRVRNLRTATLAPLVAHGGIGRVLAARIADGADLNGACNFIDYVELPQATSIGDHRHAPDEEEIYLVLDGCGRMRLEADQFEVGAGDLIRNPPGGLHGLVNAGSGPLRLFVFELGVR